jgi:hypothetical protein
MQCGVTPVAAYTEELKMKVQIVVNGMRGQSVEPKYHRVSVVALDLLYTACLSRVERPEQEVVYRS